MARPTAAPIGQIKPTTQLPTGYRFEDLPEGVIEVEPVRGMAPSLPRTQIPKEKVLLAKNARSEVDGFRRRDGTTEYSTKPDSNRVLDISTLLDDAGDAHVIRITTEGVHVDGGEGTFTAYTDNVGLSTTISRLTRAGYLGDVYVAGLGQIFKIDLRYRSVDTVTESPVCRYVTNWADRIIAGFAEGDNYKISWSANADPEDWTSTSAGTENLVQAPSDVGDEITGLFGFEQELVVLRRNSIWHASRQPFAQAPFRFRVAVAGHGCDMPYTAVQVPGAIIYADYRTRAIYAYSPGSRPQIISRDIEDELFEDLESTYWCQATFDPLRMEYILGLVTTSGATVMDKFWVFNLRRQEWSYDDGPESTALGSIVYFDPTTIDELVGTIDSLNTTIDQLSDATKTTRLFKGVESGEIIYHDATADADYDSTAFEMVIESQNFGSISRRRTIRDVILHTSNTRGGDVLLALSKDRSTWSGEKTVTLTAGSDKKVRNVSMITGDDIYWRLRASASDVRVRQYWMRIQEKGMQRT